MAMTTAEILIETLIDWGVDVVFGIPGDGINGIIEALRARQDKIRFIQTRHEEAAAFMACGYAKFTGKLGVCIATSGPGGIHLLNGLYDAKLDGQPVLAITGMPFHDLINTFTQQDVELDKLFMDVATYNCRVMGPAHIEDVTDIACRSALLYRGVSHITIPVDIQDMEARGKTRSKRNVPHHASVNIGFRSQTPPLEALSAAADVLNSGKKITMLVGRGAIHATDELEQIAEKLGAPVIKALLGKQAIPDDSPYSTGSIGLLGTEPSQDAMEDCDTLFIIGSTFPYIEFYPKPGQARCVQVELDSRRLGLRYPIDVGLVGDSKLTLQSLLPLLERKEDRSFLERAQKGMKKWNALMHERGTRDDFPMKPQVPAFAIDKNLQSDAIVTCDSGTIATWFARHISIHRGQMCTLSGNLATMACGLPYAIAAQLAFPERQVVALVGDGGLSMLVAEIATCVKYKLPVKIVVIKNNSLGQIKWEQMVLLGNPEYVCDLQPIDFAAIARACGAKAYTVDKAQDCEMVMQESFSIEGPVLIEAVVDTNEPPMPAKITVDQAKHFMESMARGQPERMKIATTILSDRVRELI